MRTAMPVIVAAAGISAGCASLSSSGGRTVSATKTTTRASTQQVRPAVVASPGECITAELVEGGKLRGPICVEDAQARGLTIVDLTDDWTPTLFARPTADGTLPAFRGRYLELAAEQGEKGMDALAELYGIVPALSVVKARLGDDERHACHAAIDAQPIGKLDRTYTQADKDAIAAKLKGRAWLGKQLEKERDKRGLADVAALETDPAWRVRFVRWRKLDETYQALHAAQQKLRCEGWLADKDVDGSFTWRMGDAVESFQRRNFVMPTERLDAETREALLLDSRELDFRLALRVLRERVAEAAGLLEDGTAGDGPRPVLGRMLDPPAMRAARGHKPLDHAAPDLVGAATETAALQLGWTSPSAVREFLERYDGIKVAIALPARPAYHAPHMELFAVIDRGDVHYDDRPPKARRKVAVRPTLVIYAQDGAIKRPLVRWPTTIGGWADERLPSGRLVRKWKESDVGPRIWRDVTAAPAWLPPKSTPDRELVKNLYNGNWALKSEIFGPGPRSAYGMVALEHLKEVNLKDGSIRHDDNGIRTHGSSSVTSIVSGTSHGCHRLFNQLATRLGNFLLQHRDHEVKGEQKVAYRRTLWHNGQSFRAAIDSRGFQYELTPPVPVNVTKGRILSTRKTPPKNSAPARP
jgi:hypothetical protein